MPRSPRADEWVDSPPPLSAISCRHRPSRLHRDLLMSSLRLALPAAAWRLPLRRAIQSVAAAGAEGVQFDVRSEVAPNQFGETARRQLRHYLEENDLQVAACTFATQGTLVDPDRLDARVAAIRNVLLFVRQLGANVLTVRAGAIPLESQTTEYERLQTILGDLAAVGNRAGVTVALSSLGNTSSALPGAARQHRRRTGSASTSIPRVASSQQPRRLMHCASCMSASRMSRFATGCGRRRVRGLRRLSERERSRGTSSSPRWRKRSTGVG